MAEWFAEGLLERLVCEEDALAAQLRQSCTFHVVPNMNPDGSVRGKRPAENARPVKATSAPPAITGL